jgi:glycosyltransferase involved in cell wall biosynthesis
VTSKIPLITVVMPAFNEELGVAKTVKGFFDTGVVEFVIVVDNNSTDNTRSQALSAGAQVIHEARQGYGFACKSGLDAVKTEVAVLTESDNSFDPTDLHKLISYSANFEMVNGARIDSRIIANDADWTLPYRLANYIVAKFMQFLYLNSYTFKSTGFHEVGGTFRAFQTKTWQEISPFVTEGKSAFLPEITTLYLRKHKKIIEIPVSYNARVGTSKISGSRINAAKLAVRMILIIIRNRFKILSK